MCVYLCIYIYIYITYYGAFLHSICIYIDMHLEYVSDWISWALGPFLIEGSVREGATCPSPGHEKWHGCGHGIGKGLRFEKMVRFNL
jgi:hypothetical protein